MRATVYDAGALIVAERDDRRFNRLHRLLLTEGIVPVVPATVLAQVWVGGVRQALVAKVLRNCETEPFTDERARNVGALRAKSGHNDIVDVSVVECALRRRAAIITSDPGDIRSIADITGTKFHIEPI